MRTVFRFCKRLIGWMLAMFLLAGCAAAGLVAWQGWNLYQNATAAEPIASMYGKISAQEGFVTFDELPDLYVDAVISVEDRHFLQHNGIDVLAIARALWMNARTRTLAEGGSTITQQLAKNELFTQEKKLARKAAEVFAARAIEKSYTKREIFEMYVNTIYFGSGYYGIRAAAQGYFGKEPSQLADCEAVLLAGLPNAPSVYSPDSNPDLARKRARVVLDRMVKCGKLTEPQAVQIEQEAETMQFVGR